MPRLDIAVTGSGMTTLPAEHAILSLHLSSCSFPTPEEASLALEKFIAEFSQTLALYCPNGEKSGQRAAIAYYSIDTREVVMHHERNIESSSFMSSKMSVTKSHSGGASLSVVFADFDTLNSLVSQFKAMDNVRVHGVRWGLGDFSLAEAHASSRKSAARDALQRARDYAEAVADLAPPEAAQKVKAVNVKEMRKYDISTKSKRWCGRKTGGPSVGVKGNAAEVHYEPMDVVVEVKVEGKFIVEA